MPAILFPLPDAELAAALREINRLARGEGFRFGGWDGFKSPAVESFIAANTAS